MHSVAANGTGGQEIDEDLHSRQLAVYGRESMRRMAKANVLICGVGGLGAEIGGITAFSVRMLYPFRCGTYVWCYLQPRMSSWRVSEL